MLDEQIYDRAVNAAFQRILSALDQIDPDVLEADSTGEMVTVTARSGAKVVVNTQRAVRQIWVAGSGRGVHFSFHPHQGEWKDDKQEGLELFGWVEKCVGEMTSPLTPP